MGVSNTHEDTGLAYGVLQGNSVPELLDDIFTFGEDLTYDEERRELTERLAATVEESKEECSPLTTEELAEHIRGNLEVVVDDFHYKPAELVKNIDCYELAELVLEGGEIDGEEILDQLETAGLWDCIESDEHAYSYTLETDCGPIRLSLDWLGGAPLIWVFESPYVTYCKGCSPCIPCAGDLEHPISDAEAPPDELFSLCSSMIEIAKTSQLAETLAIVRLMLPSRNPILAYCLPKDEMPEDWNGKVYNVPEDTRKLHESEQDKCDST